MTAKHTPGPHKVVRIQDGPHVGVAVVSLETGAIVHQEEHHGYAWEGHNFEGVRYHRSPAQVEADAHLFAASPDHALVCRLLIAGKWGFRWEPFESNDGQGELCFNGLRYCTKLDEFGVPKLTDLLREALAKAEPA